MILKIETHNEGWRFVDGITEINTEPTSSEKYKKDYNGHGRQYDGMFLSHHALSDAGELVNTESNMSSSIKEVIAYFRNNTSAIYLIDRTAFLMSDEGKTIERIN